MEKTVLLVGVLLTLGAARTRTRGLSDTCKDVAVKHPDVESDSRVFNHGQPDSWDYLIYCDVQLGYGYTFLSTVNFDNANINITVHMDTNSDFKVVFLATDGKQYETVISKGSDMDYWTDITIEYFNVPKHDVYRTPGRVYNVDMSPYIKAGIMTLPRTNLSYKANDEVVSDEHCKNYRFGYAMEQPVWAFLFNRENKQPREDKYSRSKSPFLTKWIELARPAAVTLPRNYFSFFEASVGSCNYMTSDDFPDIIGAVMGLKYVITCDTPVDIEHGTYTHTGNRYEDTVTYACNDNYKLKGDNDTFYCSKQGKWEGGQIPTCEKILPESCSDVFKLYNTTLSGEYLIYRHEYIDEVVYCELNGAVVTTFFTSKLQFRYVISYIRSQPLNVFEVVIRARYEDGRQVESVLRPTTANKEENIQFRLARKVVYVYIQSVMSEGQKRGHERADLDIGYKLNGEDVVTKMHDCCSTNQRHIVFSVGLGEKRVSYARYMSTNEDPTLNPVAHKWLTDATDVAGEHYMPTSYFDGFGLIVGLKQYGILDFKNLTGIAIGYNSDLD